MSNLFEGVLAFIGIGVLVLVLYYIYDLIHERKCRTKAQFIASACYNLQSEIAKIADDPFLGKDLMASVAAIRKEISLYLESFRQNSVRSSLLVHTGKSLQRRAQCTLASAQTDIEVRTAMCEEYTHLLPIVAEAIEEALLKEDSLAAKHWQTLGLASSDVKGGGILPSVSPRAM